MKASPDARATARRLGVGLAFWSAFCLAAVALRGVRWDENYEFAQAITRAIAYPQGHPLVRYTTGMFSLQTHALAALSYLSASPTVLCGCRNVLFLMATVLPAFLFGALLARRIVWGHIAAAMSLLGAHLAFYSTYPQFVWPGMYSNGHVGTGYALAVLYLLAAGRWRAGFFLVGLMPCIHLGQWAPVLLFAILFTCAAQRRFQRSTLNRAFAWGAFGLAVSTGFWAVTRAFAVPLPSAGPYYSAADPHAVWLGYMARHASHRTIPWSTGHIALAALPYLGLAAARREARDGTPRGPWYAVVLYSLCIAGIVWTVMAIHAALGPRIPFLLISWMPYRLMNHVPPLLVVATVAVLADGRDRSTATGLLVAAVLIYGIVKPGLRGLAGDDLFARYLETGIGALFTLYGAAVGVLMRRLRDDRRFVAPWVVAGLVGWTALACVHQFGAACIVVGLAAAFLIDGPLAPTLARVQADRLACALALILVLVLVHREWTTRDHLHVSPFERRVAEYLEARGEPDAMLVADYRQEGLQARTGHPVITDMATMTWIAYRPSLGPSMDKLYGDLYGIRFLPQPEPEPTKAWFGHWADRNRDQWQVLADQYSFHYVIAPDFIELDLPRVIDGQTQSLYHIPARSPNP